MLCTNNFLIVGIKKYEDEEDNVLATMNNAAMNTGVNKSLCQDIKTTAVSFVR